MVVESIQRSLGGKGANQALAIEKLEYPVHYVGMVGDDANGSYLRSKLLQYGIRSWELLSTSEASTGTAIILLEESGENRILVAKGANDRIQKSHVDKYLVPNEYAAVLLQLEIPLDTVSYIIQRSQECGIPIIVDAGPAVKCDLGIFQGVEILSPNQTEAQALTGLSVDSVDEAKRACEFLRSKTGVNKIVLKMGGAGALVCEDDEFYTVEAFRVRVRDTTGAGDSFTAALSVGFASGWSLRDAVVYACMAGAITVSREGIYDAMPTKKEVDDFRDRIASETR